MVNSDLSELSISSIASSWFLAGPAGSLAEDTGVSLMTAVTDGGSSLLSSLDVPRDKVRNVILAFGLCEILIFYYK